MDNINFTIIEKHKLDDLLLKVNKVYELLQTERIQPDKLYSNEDACKYLQVCSKTLQNYRDDGLIEFTQISRKIYYKQSDLNTFLNTYKNETFLNQIKKNDLRKL